MTTTNLLDIIGGTSINALNEREINDIKIDTRKLHDGDAFIAIQGHKYDGHHFIKDAIKKKASCIIVERTINIDTDIPIILVNSTIEALHKLASYNRNKYDIPVIAITGSLGKTTTKEVLSHILSKKYKVLRNYGNENNLIGVPMTLLKLDDTYDYVILELGMNHKGEIRQLSQIVKPDICILTSIGSSHIGNLKSKRKILKAKLEIMTGNPEAILIINGENKYLKHVKGEKCYLDDYDYIQPFPHLQMNYHLAIKASLILGLNYREIVSYLKDYKLFKQRMNIFKSDKVILIDDCYNASYESVVGGLSYADNLVGDKYIILGDILELGKYSKRIHKKISKYLTKCHFKEVLLVGDATSNIIGTHFDNKQHLIAYLDTLETDENKVFYVKGSRGMHLEDICTFIKDKYSCQNS